MRKNKSKDSPNSGKELVPANGESKALVRSSGRPASRLAQELENKLLALDRRLELLFERPKGRTITFLGTQPGDDSSRVVFEFARLSADRLNRRVLLLMCQPVIHADTNGAVPWSAEWDTITSNPSAAEESVHQYGGTNMWYAQVAANIGELPAVVQDTRFRALMAHFRSRFDMILLDSPTLAESSSSASLSAMADGVVLVVEAGKVREQAIKNQIREIERDKGTILGVVLNKRRYPIPDFIYKRL